MDMVFLRYSYYADKHF